MARRRQYAEPGNHERWAIPYADLLTLLLAFFVVMYSISSVNEGQYRVLSEAMLAAFRGEPRVMDPIRIDDERPVGSFGDFLAEPLAVEPPEYFDVPVHSASSALTDQWQGHAVGMVELRSALGNLPGADGLNEAIDTAGLAAISEEVRNTLQVLIDSEDIIIRQTPLWLELEVKTDILFPSGSAEVTGDALGVLERIGRLLAPFPNLVRVEGHTDNVPIATAVYPSNWELSAARSANVVRIFQSVGVAPDRLVAIGLGEYRPVADNDRAEGRNANRRVLIVVLGASADQWGGRLQIDGEPG